MRAKICSASVVLALVGFGLSAVPAQASPTEEPVPTPPSTAPTLAQPGQPAADDSTNTVIITFDSPQADPAAAASKVVSSAAQTVAGAEISKVQPINATTVAVTLDAKLSAREAATVRSKVENRSGVEAADPAMTFYRADTNYEGNLWNINSATSRYSVAADQAWGATTGVRVDNHRPIIVGVLDTGITAHPDLTGSAATIVGGNVVPGYDFISSGGLAGDGNGRDADPTDVGDYDAYHYSSWHGTHVSGIIAALKNSSGVVGVAPDAKVEPLRILGIGGRGSEADLIAAILWGSGYPVAGAPANPNPVNVLNLSLGGPGKCSTALQNAINKAVARRIPVVVSAGNSNAALSKYAPANCKKVISVTATGHTGPRAYYSNYGTTASPATIAAPGGSGYTQPCSAAGGECGGVLSTLNAGRREIGSPNYGVEAGTSMAAPHVAGVLALLRALHPAWSVDQLTAAIRGSAIAVPNCSSIECGAGVVNAGWAVRVSRFFSNKKKPSIGGRFKVGRTLSAKRGSWSPSPASVRYQWLVNGKIITNATKTKYKLPKKYKGKSISVQITVLGSAGYAARVMVSSGHKVKK